MKRPVPGAGFQGQSRGEQEWGAGYGVPCGVYGEVFAMGICVGEILGPPAGEDRKSLGTDEERA